MAWKSVPRAPGTLICPGCKETKPESEFYRRVQGTRCKPCYRAADRVRYVEMKELINAYKRLHGCCVCGESNPACLEMHHLDPREKSFSVGAKKSCGRNKILAEMEKCSVMCANCHAKLHWGG